MSVKAPRSPTDTELVDRCLDGDSAAWQTLVDRYGRLVHSVPVRYKLPAMMVDDIGQEVFLALAEGLHRIEDPERLSSWLLTTARRITWKAIQRHEREQVDDSGDIMAEENRTTNLTNEHSAASNLLGSRSPSYQELVDGWTYQRALRESMDRLNDRCYRLLSVLFLDPEEPSYEEISEMLSMPVGSIGPTRNRCLEKLRQILEGLGHGDLL